MLVPWLHALVPEQCLPIGLQLALAAGAALTSVMSADSTRAVAILVASAI